MALALGFIAAVGARAGCDVDVTMCKPDRLRCVLGASASTARELRKRAGATRSGLERGRKTGFESNNKSSGMNSSWSSAARADDTGIVSNSSVSTDRKRVGLEKCVGDVVGTGDGGL